jgi:uncharacterized phage protein (TIGR02220 family)
MYYYKRNIGDYHKKAGRLSILQHGAYTLLIDACYDREIFPTVDDAIDWVWASSEAEVDAVKFVLKKFFTEDDGFYIQSRIQEDLDKYHANNLTNKRIAIERERKKKQTKGEAKSTKREQPVNGKCDSPNETPPNQEPLTTNQEPRTNNQLKDTSAKANHSFELFQYWCDVMGKSISTSKLTPKRDKAIKARLKEGYTIDQIKAAIDGCRADPFSMGKNDRQKHFNDVELICRTGEKLESFFVGSVEPEQQQFSQVTQKNINNTKGDW